MQRNGENDEKRRREAADFSSTARNGGDSICDKALAAASSMAGSRFGGAAIAMRGARHKVLPAN